ncbi:MAG TPA: hypothetical protein VF867_14235 [Arthrobacter sp.]
MSEISSNPFLRETETWVDRSGNEHALKDMTEKYLRHVLGFLESIEDALFAAEIEEAATEQLVAVFEPWRYPDAHRSVDFPTARLWLHSTPLVKAITGLLGN